MAWAYNSKSGDRVASQLEGLEMIMVSVIIYFGKQTLISPCWGSHARESIPEPPRTSKVRPWSPPIHLNILAQDIPSAHELSMALHYLQEKFQTLLFDIQAPLHLFSSHLRDPCFPTRLVTLLALAHIMLACISHIFVHWSLCSWHYGGQTIQRYKGAGINLKKKMHSLFSWRSWELLISCLIP